MVRPGMKVTVIGLGGVFLNKHSFNDGVATVRRALELGIRYFDTSPADGRMPGGDKGGTSGGAG